MEHGESKRVEAGKGWVSRTMLDMAGRVSPGGRHGEQRADKAETGLVPPSDTKRPEGRWTESRIAAVEALWGEGFTMPGGAQETTRVAQPMALSPDVSLLLLGGGLGGPAHAISNGFGAWVASFESDPVLCAIAASRRPSLDPGGRITIAGWDRAAPSFQARSAHCALSLEALRGAKLAPLLESLAVALRPQGQILLTELVSEVAPSDKDREFAAWCRLADRLPEMPSSQDVTGTLQRLHFNVRIMEDMSDRHITQTLGGWREAVRNMAAGPRPTPHSAAAFVTEAELWLLRIRLMRRLGVRLMRWHAVGSG